MQLTRCPPPRVYVDSAPVSALVTAQMLAACEWSGYWANDDVGYYLRARVGSSEYWFCVTEPEAHRLSAMPDCGKPATAGVQQSPAPVTRGMLIVGRVFMQAPGERTHIAMRCRVVRRRVRRRR